MSESKRVMAAHLCNVQKNLMGITFESLSLEHILPIIFNECLKENITFYFSFIENTAILNLRDIRHDNYELNIRLHHETTTDYEGLKKSLLINAFLITSESTSSIASSAENEEVTQHLISNDKPVPKHIRNAIEKIQSKGIPVTTEAIRNHLPLSQMSTSARLECNKYLKEMEASS